MADDRLPRTAAELLEQGRRRRGRPRLRWEDCVKRDVRKSREEKTGRRRQETEEGGKDYQMRRWRSCGQHLTPDKGKKRKRERTGRHHLTELASQCQSRYPVRPML